jgi:DNA-binding transcriptional LysR family regulator
MVRDGTLDFAMRPKMAGKLDPALVFRPLFRDDIIIVGRKNHPLRNAGSIARLSTAAWVRGALGGGTSAGSVNQLFSTMNLPIPRTILQCDSYNVTVSVIAKSDALGIIVRRFLATAPACDLLQEIKIAEPMPTVTIGMIMRKDPPLTPTAAAMAKIITAVTRQFTVRP